ncbi:S9 family peptidase, partial [Streptomyces sp. SID10244]|nr:S9 family peptidase [Streptomyces sp. SID10244]
RGTALDEATTVFAGEIDDVSVGATFDNTPGYERHFASRATDFFNALRYEIRGDQQILVDVPTDAHSGVRHDWLFVMPRSDWTVGGATHAA